MELLGNLHTEITNALAAESSGHRKLNKKKIADILGWDKSALSRKLQESSNITIETMADLAFALDRVPLVFFMHREKVAGVRLMVDAFDSGPGDFIAAVSSHTKVCFIDESRPPDSKTSASTLRNRAPKVMTFERSDSEPVETSGLAADVTAANFALRRENV